MGKLGFYYNQDICTGCRVCQIACKDTNNTDIGILYRRVRTLETGTYPTVSGYFFSGACNHCENPACVENCPTGAMYVSESDGTVQHDDETCIGCKTCVVSCPYEVPQYNEEANIVGKCYTCTNIRKQYGEPPCVASCPMHALEFGDIDELKAAHPDAVSDIALLPSSSMTTPSLLISKKPAADEADYVQINP